MSEKYYEKLILNAALQSIIEKPLKEIEYCLSRIDDGSTYKKCWIKRIVKIVEELDKRVKEYEELKVNLKKEYRALKTKGITPASEETIKKLNKRYENR